MNALSIATALGEEVMKATNWGLLFRKFQGMCVKGLKAAGEVALIAFTVLFFPLACMLFLPLVPLLVLMNAYESRRFVKSLPPLVRQLGDSAPEKRRQAFEQLMAMGNEAIPLLISVVNPFSAKNWDAYSAQWFAIKGLAQLRARDAVEELIEVLEDSDFNPPEIRSLAAWALGEIGDERAIPHLIEALTDEKIASSKAPLWLQSDPIDLSFTSEPVKHHAAEALRKFGLGDLVDALSAVLEGKNEEAIWKLKEFEAHRDAVVEVLISALNSRSPNLSSQAAWALGELKAVKAIPELERKVKSPFTPKIVKEACREALKKLKFWAYLPRSIDPKAFDTSSLPRPANSSELPTEFLPSPSPPPEDSSSEVGSQHFGA